MQNDVFTGVYQAYCGLVKEIRELMPMHDFARSYPDVVSRLETLAITLSLKDVIHSETLFRQSYALIYQTAMHPPLARLLESTGQVQAELLAYLDKKSPLEYARLAQKYNIVKTTKTVPEGN